MSKKYNVAVVGATGLVGRTMVKVLEEKKFPINNLSLFASKRSIGKKIQYLSNEIQVQELTKDSFKNIDIALFSAGTDVSKEFAPKAVDSNCVVIDNSSYWRMNKNVPLIVPEVNSNVINSHKGIIANPNCSTIQLVIPLYALQKHFNLKRVVISTYQAISGAGQKGINLFQQESSNKNNTNNKIYNNIAFHDVVGDSDFTSEEIKMLNETRKILSLPDLKMAVTCVRLPIENSHSISANIELGQKVSIEQIRSIMKNQNGIILLDDIKNKIYPQPQLSNGHDEVFVGRIRIDDSVENGIYLWITADNLRKGAASNAVQIAQLLIK